MGDLRLPGSYLFFVTAVNCPTYLKLVNKDMSSIYLYVHTYIYIPLHIYVCGVSVCMCGCVLHTQNQALTANSL